MNSKSVIQSLLYVVGNDGINVNNLKKVLNISSDDIRNIVKELKQQYEADENCGLTIKEYGSHFYLLTKPENKEFISKIVDVRLKNPLTPAMMETLSYIAYNNPTTAVKIDELRGVSSDSAVKRLEVLKLVENIGRASTPGRPYQYQVTEKFFNLFGIKSLKDLKPLDNTNDLIETVDFFNSNRFDEE